MPIFKTGSLLSAPGIKIVTASSFLTSERKLFMGKGLARDLKIKVPGIDKIFGRMILENGGHGGRYGLLIYERWGVFQVRYRFNERPDLELIAYGMERLKEFAQETNYIIHLEYPGITEEELTKEEVGPKLDKKAFRIDLGKTKNWGSKKFFLVKFAISHLQNLK